MPLSKAHLCALLVPNARKGSDSLLVCRSAPLSRKLDTSPLPGRPRKVRRLDDAVGASSSFSLKWVFRGTHYTAQSRSAVFARYSLNL